MMVPHYSSIRKLGQLDRDSPRFSDQLITLLGEEKDRDRISNLSVQDAKWFVDYLDDVRTTPTPYM